MQDDNGKREPLDPLSMVGLSVPTERRWAALCYIPVFNVIVCLLASVRMVASEFCQFHVRQGLCLFGFWLFTVFVAVLSQTLSLMLWGVALVLHISGVFIALGGKMTKIPLLGNFADLIPKHYFFRILTGKSPENSTKN